MDSDVLNMGFALKQFQIQDYAMLPIIDQTITIDNGANANFTKRYSIVTFAQSWPKLFEKYNSVRFNIKFELEITSSWNQTGLICMAFIPVMGSAPCTNINRKLMFAIPPKHRVFARIGKDTKLTLSVPWLSEFPTYTNPPEPNLRFTPPYGFNHAFDLHVTSVVPLRSIADGKQTAIGRLIMSPYNIAVGFPTAHD